MRVVGWLSIFNWDGGDKVQTDGWSVVAFVWIVWRIWFACQLGRMAGSDYRGQSTEGCSVGIIGAVVCGGVGGKGAGKHSQLAVV